MARTAAGVVQLALEHVGAVDDEHRPAPSRAGHLDGPGERVGRVEELRQQEPEPRTAAATLLRPARRRQHPSAHGTHGLGPTG